MASGDDQISRADLALVLSSAADLQTTHTDAEMMSITEAERIASEVGIAPAEFRAALRGLRSSQAGGSGVLGPDSIIFAESDAAGSVSAADAARMLSRAQVLLPVRAGIESPAAGTWRTADRNTLIQVTSDHGTTSIAATVDRRLIKATVIGGGAWLGTVVGITVVPALVMATVGSVEAVAFAQAAGLLGGASAGFWAGRAAWAQSARRAHSRVLTALERMRDVIERRPQGEQASAVEAERTEQPFRRTHDQEP